MPTKPTIITFYSYKGGTGRSMALANVGCLLARQGKKVLMIDWDLESPGLHRYFRGLSEATFDARSGLIEIFWDIYKGLTAAPPSFDDAEALLRSSLEKCVLATNVPDLSLLKAGRFDQDYSRRVTGFPWADLYERFPGLFEAFANLLTQEYEYVLIDSRSGVTDIGGICTMLMPHKLVTVFTPNAQSLDGVTRVIRSATRYRAESNDLRPLAAFPLPSRVEASEAELRRIWRQRYQSLFEELFAEVYPDFHGGLGDYFGVVQIPHVPYYSYGEEVAVLVGGVADRLSLGSAYRDFTDILINQHVPWE